MSIDDDLDYAQNILEGKCKKCLAPKSFIFTEGCSIFPDHGPTCVICFVDSALDDPNLCFETLTNPASFTRELRIKDRRNLKKWIIVNLSMEYMEKKHIWERLQTRDENHIQSL